MEMRPVGEVDGEELNTGDGDVLEYVGGQRLRDLLSYLSEAAPAGDAHHDGWRIVAIGGGWCNRLYRVFRDGVDLAVKFTMRDSRDRARREWLALTALREAGLAIAPQPVCLDVDSYALPVVVQTWLPGRVSPEPPGSEQEWARLLEHMLGVHSVGRLQTRAPLPRAVVAARDADEACGIARQIAQGLPPEARAESVHALLRALEAARWPAWEPVAETLCRVDWNMRNLLRDPDRWASVDWENAGWGDPAHDVAECMTHPGFAAVPRRRWEWLVSAYARQVGDLGVEERIWTYHRILLVRWVARLARYLYEIPRGLDERLVEWQEGWQEDLQAKYARYVAKATEALGPASV